ncbi:hypothetical protein ACFSTE_20115 [Aquimarina hainanensis]|uniref:Uncharacterized protein n=1 Tax=Aquimarina hainanensis TaxID=1578017 RepID=A0ABW5NCI8_9FLAO|nr:hypothetical protein [Aquimarina sp. TRL1]QKX06374.1 hypothetical protein HN014_16125 [Aquimarina sp. TRL1]
MAKFYFESSQRDKQLNPRKSTIDFILNYSKALEILEYKKLKFEALLN